MTTDVNEYIGRMVRLRWGEDALGSISRSVGRPLLIGAHIVAGIVRRVEYVIWDGERVTQVEE